LQNINIEGHIAGVLIRRKVTSHRMTLVNVLEKSWRQRLMPLRCSLSGNRLHWAIQKRSTW